MSCIDSVLASLVQPSASSMMLQLLVVLLSNEIALQEREEGMRNLFAILLSALEILQIDGTFPRELLSGEPSLGCGRM